MDGHKALRPISAHLSVLGPVSRNYSLKHLCPLLEGNEEGCMPAHASQKLSEISTPCAIPCAVYFGQGETLRYAKHKRVKVSRSLTRLLAKHQNPCSQGRPESNVDSRPYS